MRFQPEEPNEQNAGIPSAEPGVYLMMVTNWREDVPLSSGITKDVIDFVGTKIDDPMGQDFGSSLWIRGPWTRDDGTKSKGNVWQYRRLAEALGPDALEQYRTKDAHGFSTFKPTDWRGISVKITVSAWGVDEIEPAPKEEPKPTTSNTHTSVADDEIPF